MAKPSRLFLGFLSAALLSLPSLSLAQAGPGFGEITGDLTSQVSPVANLVTTMAFLFGTGLVIIGLLKFKKFAERPGDDASRPLVAIVFILGGAAVIALPSSISTGVATIFGGDAPTATAYGGGTQVLPFVNGNSSSWGNN
jgi:hypothetical protein